MKTGRLIAAILLLGLASLAASCVYLRLLQLKAQIADFDEHFELETGEGLTIHFLHPILLQKDLNLVGLKPTIAKGDETRADWTFIFEKVYPEGAERQEGYDVSIQAAFTQRRLDRVHVSETYFGFLPKDLFVEIFKAVGHADVDISERSVTATTENGGHENKPPAIATVTAEDVTKVLGQPYAQSRQDAKTTYEYRYRLAPPDHSASPDHTDKPENPAPIYSASFTFNAENTLHAIRGRLPFLGTFHYAHTP